MNITDQHIRLLERIPLIKQFNGIRVSVFIDFAPTKSFIGLDYAPTTGTIIALTLNIGFLSVGLRFRYLFFSPTPHDTNLESRYKVRW